MAAGARFSFCIGALAAGIFAGPAAATADLETLFAASGGAAARNGKSIYRKGRAAAPPPIQARLEGGPARSSENFTCAGCHGAHGEGRQQAALRVPPIDWAALTSPRPALAFWRPREAYDADTLKRAVLTGVAADGAALGAGMPIFSMSGGQADDLIAYLRILGTAADKDPGVTPDIVKIGAALPLTGPNAKLGAAVSAQLRAVFDAANARGGIYQRQILLITADTQNDAASALNATRRLIGEGVFALAANFQPAEPDAFDSLITAEEIPVIGLLALAPRESAKQNPFVWQLLPTFADQARALVDEINSAERLGGSQAPLRVSLVCADTPNAKDAMRGAKAQLARAQMVVTSDLLYVSGAFSAEETVRNAASGNPEWILFFGPSANLEQFAERLAASNGTPPAIGALTLLSPGRYDLPSFTRLRMAFAAPFVWVNKPGAPPLGQGSENPVFLMMAAAAAKTLVETMSRAGRNLDRGALQAELERLQDFETGNLPPLNFSSSSHVGAHGATVLWFGPGRTNEASGELLRTLSTSGMSGVD